MAGWQALYWDNQLVSQLAASVDNEGEKSHNFQLQTPDELVNIELNSTLTWQPFSFKYELRVNQNIVEEGARNEKDIERQPVVHQKPARKKISVIGLFSFGFKLLKSAKVIKVLFAGASLAAYSWFFSIEFALALIACLVVHEYGHIRAMKYFGMKTKGIYLIPFLGGLAVSEDKINTRWQNVVISIMGPTFGLFMSVAAMIAWWVTGNIFFAGIATFNALLNLFNMLPIVPLDGGHILKSITFSLNNKVGLIGCLLGAGLGVYISFYFGFAFLALMLLIGSLEIFAEWKMRHESDVLPLDRYGQIVSSVWYLVTVVALVAIIAYFASSGDTVLSVPLLILQS